MSAETEKTIQDKINEIQTLVEKENPDNDFLSQLKDQILTQEEHTLSSLVKWYDDMTKGEEDMDTSKYFTFPKNLEDVKSSSDLLYALLVAMDYAFLLKKEHNWDIQKLNESTKKANKNNNDDLVRKIFDDKNGVITILASATEAYWQVLNKLMAKEMKKIYDIAESTNYNSDEIINALKVSLGKK